MDTTDHQKVLGMQKIEPSNKVVVPTWFFQDVDDIMLPERVEKQVVALQSHACYIVGCDFRRIPEGSTERYTKWLQSLKGNALYKQRFRELTLIMPTWAMTRRTFYRNGSGFVETKVGTPEDMIFFYRHLETGGGIHKICQILQIYRYHDQSVSFSVTNKVRKFGVPRNLLIQHRTRHLENCVLCIWDKFSIWGAGKLGSKFFACLSPQYRKMVSCFCDIDSRKISEGYHHSTLKESRPVIHFTQVKPPFIVCVNLGLTQGEFEKNLKSMNFIEGFHYFHVI